MIADTSVWIDHFRGEAGSDLESFRAALHEGRVVMAPVVLSELLSSQELPPALEKSLLELEMASPSTDYWAESGRLRRRLAKLGFNASLADCLVIQTCAERGMPLLTRDQAMKKWAAKLGVRVL